MGRKKTTTQNSKANKNPSSYDRLKKKNEQDPRSCVRFDINKKITSAKRLTHINRNKEKPKNKVVTLSFDHRLLV